MTELSSNPVKIFLGEFEVVEVRLNHITIHIGHQVHVTIHLGIPHNIQPGDKLPMFTEIEHANAGPTSIQ